MVVEDMFSNAEPNVAGCFEVPFILLECNPKLRVGYLIDSLERPFIAYISVHALTKTQFIYS